jgi:alpha/beta superfamily hydrolase
VSSIPESASLVIEDVFFCADRPRLHGELAYAETGSARVAAVFAGPHPLLGGNMHNNVVRGMSDALAQHGVVSLRFNYRGVGRSEGPPLDVKRHLAQFWQTSHVPDELDLWRDVQAAVDCVRDVVGPDVPMLAIGYSFGCALLSRIRAARVLVAPTIAKHDYDSFLGVRGPTLVIASEDDFASDARRLRRWFGRLAAPKQLVLQSFDNHFFRGQEAWLAETAFDFLQATTEGTV